MNQALVVDLARNAITMALMIAAPMLAVALLIGTIVSIIQTIPIIIAPQKSAAKRPRIGTWKTMAAITSRAPAPQPSRWDVC